MKLLPFLAAMLGLPACAYPAQPPALSPVTRPAGPATGALAATEARAPVTILISIDGFRPDYLDRGRTPVLAQLAREGVSGAMRAAFPSKTFPNHWTLVTGMVPDRHGIVANKMKVSSGSAGSSILLATVDPRWWNAAEPIWVAAERAGIRTASVYWPGSAVAWGGVQSTRFDNEVTGGARPADWLAYAEGASDEMRVRTVVDWLSRPAATRPRFIALYFDEVDTAGHHYGIASPQVDAALAGVDRALGLLAGELARMGQPSNVVIVSDHGMASTSPARTVALDAILPATDARVFEVGPLAAIHPLPGREAAVAAALARPIPHLSCWPRERVPARLRYGRNPRIAPFLCLADEGWETVRTAADAEKVNPGDHGYDPAAPSMRALFIANGPAFARGKRLATFDNVDVYPLLRDLIGLPPAAGIDGSDAPFRRVLVRP